MVDDEVHAFAGVKSRPEAFRNIRKLLESDPTARIVRVRPAKGGYEIVPPDGSGTRFVPTAAARSGHLAGPLARLVTDLDAAVLFDYAIPKPIRRAVYDKLSYVVRKGTDPFADGGVCRGYQLIDRLYLGDLDEARTQLAAREGRASSRSTSPGPARVGAGATVFTYTYMTSDGVRHAGEIRADSKDEAYAKLRSVGIKPIRVLAEGESTPATKRFFEKG